LSVAGNTPPETLNPAPATLAELTVRAPVPEEVSVRVLVSVEFNVTLPNARALVLSVNCGVVAVVPDPLRATRIVLPVVELLEIARVPLAAPMTVGLKLT